MELSRIVAMRQIRRASDDDAWERFWRESSDQQLMESARAHFWQCHQFPQPGFFRFAQICRVGAPPRQSQDSDAHG
jgi:hypothetical protein